MKFVPEIQAKLLNLFYSRDDWKYLCWYYDDIFDALPDYKESSIKYHMRILVKADLIKRIRAVPTFYEPNKDANLRESIMEAVLIWTYQV